MRLTDRLLAAAIALLLFHPIVAVVHELGHVGIAMAVGVKIRNVHLGWGGGSVDWSGYAGPNKSWMIALGGIVISSALGATLVVLALRMKHIWAVVRYALIMDGLGELLFALVVYPLVGLILGSGDWIDVYQFRRSPWLSTVAFLWHIAAIAMLWTAWKARIGATLAVIDSP